MLDDESTDSTTPAAPGSGATPPAKTVRRRATKATAAPSTAPFSTPDAPHTTDQLTSDAGEPVTGEPATGETTAAPAKRIRKAPAKKAAPRKRATKAAGAAPDGAPEQDGAAAQDNPAAAEPTASGESGVDAVEEEPVVETGLGERSSPAFAAEPEPEPAAPTTRRRSRAPAVVVTFQAPEATAAAAKTPKTAAAKAADTKAAVADAAETAETAETAELGDGAPRRRRRAGTAGAVRPSALLPTLLEPDLAPVEQDTESVEGDDDDAEGTGVRRRRRGRRGRGRRPEGETPDEVADDAEAETDGAEADGAEDEGAEDDDSTEGAAGTRRRRRRRRGGAGGGAATEDGDEGDVPTVVHVREPRERTPRARRDGGGVADEDGVRGIAGSTRMAAKRVRRQEGRDSGRKRPPILTEAEFLARREAVDRVMVVRQKGDRTQIAVLEDGILVEHYVTKATATSYAGNVYLGRVQNVLPSMEAAFVDIGKGRNAVLYAGEVNYDAALAGNGPRKIEQVLKSGQEVLVQVSKDPIGQKGARLTSQISLPGRYLVYVPEGSMTGISRKLPEGERTRLKAILKQVVPEGAGVIIRTAAEGASEEEIAGDVRRLQAQWEVISGKVAKGGAPVQLHAEPDLVIRVVRDIFNEDFARLVVQGDTEWDTIKDYVEFVAPDLAPRLAKWAGERDVFAEHRIDEQLLKALDRKVHLPSGGSLVIDRTEAMVVVDVNTGKFVGKGGNLEETVTRNNLEAAEEIARQLRLRDLGGIIVVDFIDMVLESNRDLVVRRLVECLGRDRTKHQVAEVTSLGLVQMTRKRVGQGLLESFSETCEHCAGRGVVLHAEPLDDRPASRDRDRTPRVTPRPPKPGPYAEPGLPAPVADEPAGESPGPKRRRRGGRGIGSATLTPESELAELLNVEPVQDALEQVAEVEAPVLEPVDEVAVEPVVEPAVPDLALEVVAEPVADAPKRRRRATSRPAGPPSAA